MPEKDALYSVIRKVERSEPVDERYQNLIERRLTRWRRTYYLISHNNTGRATAHHHIVVPVKAHEKDWTLHLCIDYTATTVSGLARRVAEKIVDALAGENPQNVLEQTIRDLTGEYISTHGGPAAFIAQYEKLQAGLVTHIKTQIEDSVGLSLSLNLNPTTNGQPLEKTRKVEKELSFNVLDWPKPITGHFSLDLDAQPGVWPYIFRGSLDQLVTNVMESAGQFLKTASLQEVVFEMQRIRQRLHEQLEKLSNRWGRTVGRLSLEIQSPVGRDISRVQRITLEKLTFPNLLEYPETVEAQCELQLELEHLGAYAENKFPDLKVWAGQTMRQAILTKLLDVPYIDLFLGVKGAQRDQTGFIFFDRKLKETEQMVQVEARLIGYKCSVSMRTNLQFDELRRGFTIAIKDEEYETRVPGYSAGLDVEIEARITDENKIRELFRQDVDIKKVIRRTVGNEIRQQLRQISPEAYYTHFEDSEETASGTVMADLSNAIKASMELFNAAVVRVTCTQRLTGLAKLFYELLSDQKEITIFDARSNLEFTVVYQVDSWSKEHWEQFQAQRPSPDKVQKIVTYCIKQRLSSVGRNPLMQMHDSQMRDELERIVGGQDVPKQLGVTIKIIHFARNVTGNETAFHKHRDTAVTQELETMTALQARGRSILEKSLEELENQRLIEIRNQDLTAIARIDEQIRSLKEQWDKRGENSLPNISSASNKAAREEINNLDALTTGRRSGRLLSMKEQHQLREGKKTEASPGNKIPHEDDPKRGFGSTS